jgi:5-methylcytosine-specific restriction endonuclease McrA
MPQGRSAVPAKIKRAVLVEAGHRCAIPTCRVGTTEIAHIKPWRQVREHAFENLIALCPTCHARFDKGEIDRKAMQQYKANLGVINGRYGEIERRVLALFAENPSI